MKIHTTRVEWEWSRLDASDRRGRVECSCAYASDWSTSDLAVIALHRLHVEQHHAELRVPFVPSLIVLREAVLRCVTGPQSLELVEPMIAAAVEPVVEPMAAAAVEPMIAADAELDLEIELAIAEDGAEDFGTFLDELRRRH